MSLRKFHKGYSNLQIAEELINGFMFVFRLHYHGPRVKTEAPNLPSLQKHPDNIMKEIASRKCQTSRKSIHHYRFIVFLIMYFMRLVEHMVACLGCARSHTTLLWSALEECVRHLFGITVNS